ncbi:MAG: GAF domain-containing protein [Planctomycetes bacterium]|nr:GAF domain-containing protein [Planctomycetota bacterium]
MQSPTQKLPSRLPINATRQRLTFVLFSEDARLREQAINMLMASRKFSLDRDSIVEIATPEQARAINLEAAICLLFDASNPKAADEMLSRLDPTSAVVLLMREGRHDEDRNALQDLFNRFPFDDEIRMTPAESRVDTLIRRVRELVHLRSRTFHESTPVTGAEKLRRLNRIGVALSNERSPSKLLELVLSETRHLMDADAGSVYLIEAGSGAAVSNRKYAGRAQRQTQHQAVKRADFTTKMFSLRFAAAQNDSVNIPFSEIIFPANMESIAGCAALTGQIIALEDVYDIPAGVSYHFNKNVIDTKYGYRTKSMLTIPLKNTSDEVVGIVQLINKKRDPLRRLDSEQAVNETVMPFASEDLELAHSLSSQAGVAIENVRLIDAIRHLFESFVHASVRAIEQRDPSTAGHSARVDRLTMALAQAVNDNKEGAFKDQFFEDQELVELHYACLLHDFGKIGVREHVLTKAKKLFKWEADAIIFRGEVIRREMALAATREELALVHAGHAADSPAVAEVRKRLERELHALQDDLAFLAKYTEPGFLPDEALARMQGIYNNPYKSSVDVLPLLLPSDLHSLSTRRGTLNPEDRAEVENHVSDSWKFLKQIPWTPDLARVPELAGQHHEKMNGKGYPNGVPAADTPLGSRLMAVADVFDSLTSADRPYKPAIPLERALDILDKMAADGELDPEVVKLFKQAEIWEKLKLKLVRLKDANENQRTAS